MRAKTDYTEWLTHPDARVAGLLHAAYAESELGIEYVTTLACGIVPKLPRHLVHGVMSEITQLLAEADFFLSDPGHAVPAHYGTNRAPGAIDDEANLLAAEHRETAREAASELVVLAVRP